jgi:hypothetical protein
LVERFLAAATEGDLRGLEQVLATDVISWADGGGQAPAARRPVVGRDNVVRYLLGALGKFAVRMEILQVQINGEPAILVLGGGAVAGVLVPEFADGQISALRIVSNPDKLRFAAKQLPGLSHSGGLAGS